MTRIFWPGFKPVIVAFAEFFEEPVVGLDWITAFLGKAAAAALATSAAFARTCADLASDFTLAAWLARLD